MNSEDIRFDFYETLRTIYSRYTLVKIYARKTAGSDLLARLIGRKPAYAGRWKTCWAEPRRRPRVAYGSGFDLGKPPSRLLAQA